jgi:uncharacterized NAD(P)/FAD-binding protein YdhS
VTAIELARQHLERASAGYYEWSPEVYDTLARALITAIEERDAARENAPWWQLHNKILRLEEQLSDSVSQELHDRIVDEHLDRERAIIASLKAALREACDLAEEGWEYASDYFRDKHDSAGRIAELLKLAGEP